MVIYPAMTSDDHQGPPTTSMPSHLCRRCSAILPQVFSHSQPSLPVLEDFTGRRSPPCPTPSSSLFHGWICGRYESFTLTALVHYLNWFRFMTVIGHISGLTYGEWHPKTKETILTSSEDGSLRIWDVNDFKSQKQV